MEIHNRKIEIISFVIKFRSCRQFRGVGQGINCLMLKIKSALCFDLINLIIIPKLSEYNYVIL